MDLIILLVSVASLSANIYMAKKISDWLKQAPLEVELEPVWENKILDCSQEAVSLDLSQQSPTIVDDESKYAWRNATGLPASGPPSVSPSMPPPKSGPLERPYGFPG